MEAKKKRVKDDRAIIIGDWKEADRNIKAIGIAQAGIAKMESSAKKAITEIKRDLAERVKKVNKQIKLIHKSLEQFASEHEAEFGKKRSRKLAYGSLGWRKSTVTSIKENTLLLIKRLLPKKVQDKCISTKESVIKSALSTLSKKDLKRIGADISEKDKFFVEPAKSKAVEY